MLGWWYSQGWLWVIKSTQQHLDNVSHTYAVKVLFRTWFAPWKQIHKESTFLTFFKDAVDNAISRGIGSVVRGTILLWAGFLSLLIVFGGLVFLLIWPFIPLLIIILPVLTLSGVSL